MEVQDDPMGEEVVNLWEAEDPPDEIGRSTVVEQVTRKFYFCIESLGPL